MTRPDDRSARTRVTRTRFDVQGDHNGSPAVKIRLLEGAADAFGKKGYAETVVEDILEASGLSRPTFYKFFKSKDEAFNSLSEMANLSLVQTIKGAVAIATGPIEKLERAIEAYLRWRVSTGAFGIVLDMEARRPGTHAHDQRSGAVASITSFFEEEVRRADRLNIDPLLYQALVAAIETTGNSLLRPRVSDADIQRCKRVIFRVVYAALGEGDDPIPPLPRIVA